MVKVDIDYDVLSSLNISEKTIENIVFTCWIFSKLLKKMNNLWREIIESNFKDFYFELGDVLPNSLNIEFTHKIFGSELDLSFEYYRGFLVHQTILTYDLSFHTTLIISSNKYLTLYDLLTCALIEKPWIFYKDCNHELISKVSTFVKTLVSIYNSLNVSYFELDELKDTVLSKFGYVIVDHDYYDIFISVDNFEEFKHIDYVVLYTLNEYNSSYYNDRRFTFYFYQTNEEIKIENSNEEDIKFLLKQFEKTEVLKIFVKLLTTYELVEKFIS